MGVGFALKTTREISLGSKSPSTSFYNPRFTQQHCCDLYFFTFPPLWVFNLVSVGVGFALKYLSTDFLGLKSFQTSVIFAAPSSIAFDLCLLAFLALCINQHCVCVWACAVNYSLNFFKVQNPSLICAAPSSGIIDVTVAVC